MSDINNLLQRLAIACRAEEEALVAFKNLGPEDVIRFETWRMLEKAQMDIERIEDLIKDQALLLY